MVDLTTTQTAPEVKRVQLSSIHFDEAVYPRKAHDPALVQRYADCLEQIEAAGKYMAVAQDGTLLDGKHRWLAYRTRYEAEPDREVPIAEYPVTEAHAKFALAVELNSTHGYQLTLAEKEDAAKTLYRDGRGYPQEQIAALLSVGLTRVNAWLARTLKENKERQNRQIWDRWLACQTEEEIGEKVGLTREAVNKRLLDLVKDYQSNFLPKVLFREDDWKPPIYNVWKQQEKSNKVDHFGNSEERWVENLLYYYTDPLDIVVDPFAGGGSTIDVCKRRGRRYWVSDRKPIISRSEEIRQHDITDGLPLFIRWSDVRLVYLDPPYWKQAEGQYSKDASDLANMTLEDFTSTLARLICGFGKKLKVGYVALIIQPTQWKAPDRGYVDHLADMLRLVKMPLDMRISCPYESQQCNAQMVDWAKEKKRPLVLTREIAVWKVAP